MELNAVNEVIATLYNLPLAFHHVITVPEEEEEEERRTSGGGEASIRPLIRAVRWVCGCDQYINFHRGQYFGANFNVPR